MIYLQQCCCCIDLRIGTVLIGLLHVIVDLLGGFFVAVYGESGIPDLCHKFFVIFMIIHILSAFVLVYGCIMLRPRWMLFYLLATIVKALAMIILIISDVILAIWYPVLIVYALMFIVCLYFWLVAYSFYAALGGAIFI